MQHFNVRVLLSAVFLVVGLLVQGCLSLFKVDINQAKRSSIDFMAADGEYFPQYLLDIFPSASVFNKKYPKLELIQDDVMFIEEKVLENISGRSQIDLIGWSHDGYELALKSSTGNQGSALIFDLAKNDFSARYWTQSIDAQAVLAFWSRTSHLLKIQKGVLQSSKREFFARNLAEDWSPAISPLGRSVLVPTHSSAIALYDLVQREFVAELRGYADVCQPAWGTQNMFAYSARVGLKTGIFLGHVHTHGAVSVMDLSKSIFKTECPILSHNALMMAFLSPSQDKKKRSRNNLHVVPVEMRQLSGEEITHSEVAFGLEAQIRPVFSFDSRHIFYVKEEDKKQFIEGYDLLSGQRYRYVHTYDRILDMELSGHGVLAVVYESKGQQKLSLVLTNLSEFIKGSHSPKFTPVYVKE